MVMSQIFKLVGFTKMQKSRYVENKIFFLKIKKKKLITHQGQLYSQK